MKLLFPSTLLLSLLFSGAALAQSNPAPTASTAQPSVERSASMHHKKGEHFEQADKNHDGFLDRNEVADNKHLSQHFDEIDTNKDGKLSKEELKAAHDASRAKHRDEFQAKFKAADKDGDGALTKAEAESGNMPQIAKNFDAIDANKDGKVTQDELRAFMMKHRKEHMANKAPSQ
jgi:Ca2+-binding EF-hand superfamily protein